MARKERASNAQEEPSQAATIRCLRDQKQQNPWSEKWGPLHFGGDAHVLAERGRVDLLVELEEDDRL